VTPATRPLYTFTELVYQPMLELLTYLRDNGFKTFIVSSGEVDFMRVFAERVYGVPPEQVVGSSIATRFQMGKDGRPLLVRLPKVDFMGIVHHTDAEREWAYDRTSRVGRLARALDDANAKGWTVVDMKADWKKVFAFE
jgi:hypothetical protein